jgi:hypothetical protein
LAIKEESWTRKRKGKFARFAFEEGKTPRKLDSEPSRGSELEINEMGKGKLKHRNFKSL